MASPLILHIGNNHAHCAHRRTFLHHYTKRRLCQHNRSYFSRLNNSGLRSYNCERSHLLPLHDDHVPDLQQHPHDRWPDRRSNRKKTSKSSLFQHHWSICTLLYHYDHYVFNLRQQRLAERTIKKLHLLYARPHLHDSIHLLHDRTFEAELSDALLASERTKDGEVIRFDAVHALPLLVCPPHRLLRH